jgi:hypothetical protein
MIEADTISRARRLPPIPMRPAPTGRPARRLLMLLGVLLGLAPLLAGKSGAAHPAAAPVTIPRPDHVVIVIEENHAYSDIIGSPSAPYINALAANHVSFTNSHAIEHPSQPNYLDFFSGGNQGVTGDSCPYTFSAANLGSALIGAGLTFAGYSEDLPAVGSPTCGAGGYVRRHAPWINFTNVPAATHLPWTSFPADYNSLPTISFVIPNVDHDMHDGSIQQGDTWLQQNLDGYTQWAQTHNSLLIVTWDEDDFTNVNQIATIFVGPMTVAGQYSETINHYNVLRTLEDMYGLPYAGQSANVAPITDVWTGGGPPPPTATAGGPTNTRTSVPPTAASTLTRPPTRPPSTVAPTAVPTRCAAGQFSDVRPSDYFYTPVQYLVGQNVISGYGDCSFRPYTNTTRAQMVKIVVLGFHKPLALPAPGAYTFADVPPSFPFFSMVETAAALQIVSGYGCGARDEPCDALRRPYFRPYAPVTRGQLSKIVVGAAGWALQAPAAGTFADIAPGSAFYTFAETAICHAAVSGYACGGPDEPCDHGARPYFRPVSQATRGQIAKIVYTSLTNPGACAAPVATRTVVGPAPTVTRTAVAGAPLRAVFYYPWFPEAWTQQGVFPYTNFHPSAGYYDGASPAVLTQQIAAMQYGHIAAGIASWWGQGTTTDGHIASLLTAAAGTGFAWSLYYENESLGDPPVSQLQSDLAYIQSHYATNPAFLHINGRPVLFVYADGADGCGMATRWRAANTLGFYVVLKVFSGYAACADQPDAWHQYGPSTAADSQAGHSYTISPGFWKVGEAPRLVRDLSRWQQNVQAMAASGAPLQLITTFNEWGEGTAVESAQEWATASGYGAYLDALHDNP